MLFTTTLASFVIPMHILPFSLSVEAPNPCRMFTLPYTLEVYMQGVVVGLVVNVFDPCTGN